MNKAILGLLNLLLLLLPPSLRDYLWAAPSEHGVGQQQQLQVYHPIILVAGFSCSDLEARLTDAYAPVYADGQMSGPSAYGLAGPARDDDRRRLRTVGVHVPMPRAAVGVYLALGIGSSMVPVPSASSLPSHGVSREVTKYEKYDVNGFRFHTETHQKGRANPKTINTGVFTKGANNFDYYGRLQSVYELAFNRTNVQLNIVVLKCHWFDPIGGQRSDKSIGLVEVKPSTTYSGADVFVVAHQAKQVYYLPYPCQKAELKGWEVVFQVVNNMSSGKADSESLLKTLAQVKRNIPRVPRRSDRAPVQNPRYADGTDGGRGREDEVEVEDEDEEDEVEDEVAAGYTWTLTSHPPLLATWLLSCTLRQLDMGCQAPRMPNSLLGALIKKFWPGRYTPLSTVPGGPTKLATTWADYEDAPAVGFATAAEAVTTKFWWYNQKFTSASAFWANKGKRVKKEYYVGNQPTEEWAMTIEEYMSVCPEWAEQHREAWEELIRARWLRQDEEFAAVSRRNMENRGTGGTHCAGNRDTRFKGKKIYDMMRTEKPNPALPQPRYYGNAKAAKEDYCDMVKSRHPEVDDPLSIPVDGVVGPVGHGRPHGRFPFLNKAVKPTHSTSYTRLKHTLTAEPPASSTACSSTRLRS
ncbi:hypothetical protein QYE76_027810 [Lolium multiflorum]|uniref:DUF4216 domain-containing protein n=1 Tax=Lolium multiflorum TaxID=4521 RepID=A0AAD8QMH3_LOLMU|nr:hypothetical protein QYE76_027810 [Lolium multiflorum]